MRKIDRMKKLGILFMTAMLMGSMAGCQGQSNTENTSVQAEDTAASEENQNTSETGDENVSAENAKQQEDVNENIESVQTEIPDYNNTYWRAVYFESFPYYEDMELDIMEYSEDYYRFMDVYFADDGSAEFRSVVSDNYERTSGQGQWKTTDKGYIVIENMEPFEGMLRTNSYIPRFYMADSKDAPNQETGLLALEYMDGCVYFRQAEHDDPYAGIDLANADRVRQAFEQSKYNGQEMTGEWVLLSAEIEGDVWYALESGVECTMYIGDDYATYRYRDNAGYTEEYYGMKMTYEKQPLYTDFPCEYSISCNPNPAEYEGRFQYLNFTMAPDGEYLIVQKYMETEDQSYPSVCTYTFQRGWG